MVGCDIIENYNRLQVQEYEIPNMKPYQRNLKVIRVECGINCVVGLTLLFALNCKQSLILCWSFELNEPQSANYSGKYKFMLMINQPQF